MCACCEMEIKPYGSWSSPVTPSMLVEEAVKFKDVCIDEGTLYWVEARSAENGRSVIMRWKDGVVEELLPAPYSAKSRVHEYGGASFIASGGVLYFSNFQDQHLYSLSPDGEISELSRADCRRYADFVSDSRRGLLYAVEEEHRSSHEVVNRLVKVDLRTGESAPIHEGWNFYGMPVLHPKGTHLAFITWNHPNMPWDGSTLWVGRVSSDGALIDLRRVAGGDSESIFQPQWSSDGTLYFISDRTKFWNIYRVGKGGVELCFAMNAEFGQPSWVLGLSRYGFLPSGDIASIYTVNATDAVGILDPDDKTLANLFLPFSSITYLKVYQNRLYFVGASPAEVPTLICFDLDKITLDRIRSSRELSLDLAYVSIPREIEFPTEDGKKAFALFYPPKNDNFRCAEKPPLIVKSHGGPSSHVTSALDLEIQFWTSRGIAFLNVNYGGSTGYGREYRERLKGNWGIVDVSDCANGALYLVEQGSVDPKKMAIRGSSSGGYTALATLAFKNVFSAGASYFGISDLELLSQDTHKFESRYLDYLIGPYPEQKERYVRCSPIHHLHALSCPVILFQGSEDRVVPPAQSQVLFDALKKNNIPVAYILFEGERHGFQLAKNVKRSFEAELYFYSKIFSFHPDDYLTPVTIHNFPREK